MISLERHGVGFTGPFGRHFSGMHKAHARWSQLEKRPNVQGDGMILLFVSIHMVTSVPGSVSDVGTRRMQGGHAEGEIEGWQKGA